MNVYDSLDGEIIDSSRFLRRRTVRRFYDRLRVLTVPVGESLTSQDAKDASDINFLMARFARTGEIPASDKPALYQDNTGMPESLGDAIMLSRSTLEVASTNLQAHQAALARKQAEQAEADRKELEAFRAAKPASDTD